MKRYVILVLAMCGFAIADVSLTDDIEDFVALFPTDNTISDIIDAYLKSDEKTKAAIEYVQSSGLGSLTNLPEFEAVKNFLEDAGLEPSVAINAVSRILGLINLAIASPSPGKTSEVIITGGFEGFFGDILAAFPAESIATLSQKKLLSSPVFSSFVEKITSQEFQERLTALQATERYRELFKLLSPRANLFDFVNLFATAIGLGSDHVAYKASRPIRSFHGSTDDLIKLGTNSDDVTKLGKNHLVDSEVQRAIRSLKSDESTELFNSLKKTEEYQALEKFLQEGGFDLKSLYRKFYESFTSQNGLLSGHSETDTKHAITEKVERFFDEYRKNKAPEVTKDFHQEKRLNSAASDTLVEKIRSDDFLALREALKTEELARKIKEAIVSLKD